MTDITGFGLVGQICEVAKASQLTVHIDHQKLPFVARNARNTARAGIRALG
jgi:selenophosphate synthase